MKFTFIEVSQERDNHDWPKQELQRFQIHSHASAHSHAQRRSSKPDKSVLRQCESLSSYTTQTSEHLTKLNEPGSRNVRCRRRRKRHDTLQDALDDSELPANNQSALQQLSHQPRCQRVYRVPEPSDGILSHHSTMTLQACEYYARAVAPVQQILDGIFMVNTVYTSSLLQLMLCAEEYDTAGIGSINAAIHRSRTSGKPVPKHFIESTCTAISNHRKHLETLKGQSDDLAIVTNLLLTSVSEGMGDLQSVAIFRNHLLALVTAAGGFEGSRLSPLVKQTLLQWESCSALVLNTTTVFADRYPAHMPMYPRYPFMSELGRGISKLPPGFQRLAQQGYLSLDVLRILFRCEAAFDARDSGIGGGLGAFASVPSLHSSYWDSCPSLAYGDDENGQPDFEKLVVLAVMIYCWHFFSSPCRITSILYRATKRRLVADVVRRVPVQEDERDLLFWCWMTAVDALQPPGLPLSPQSMRMLRVARDVYPEIRSCETLQAVLRAFFHHEGFLERCATFWNDNAAFW